MLSIPTLRLLHRYLDDFVAVRKAKSGALSLAELERRLKMSGASREEVQDILAEYRRHRNELKPDPDS
ncbi:MAG TPA: hypothetical protein VK463_02605 [Desulfomonilaceae bacterium]|nr:hypothetical protein [Desulfomonilaceae bacterium]